MSPCDRDDLRFELEAWIGGELPPERAAEVEAHTKTCAECKEELGWLETERKLYAARREQAAAAPPATMWAQIERRVADEPPKGKVLAFRRRTAVVGVVAAVAAAAAALLLMAGPRREQLAVEVTAPHGPAVAVPGKPTADESMDRAMNEYEQAIGTMERDYQARRPTLPPSRARKYDTQFAQLRKVVDESKQAAGRDVAGRRRVLKAYAGYMRTLKTVLLEEEETVQ